MSTYGDEERRIAEDEEREFLTRVRRARTEDEALDALREAGSLGGGLSLVGQHGGFGGDDLAYLSPSELIERIHEIAKSRAMYVADGGPAWCIEFCDDKKAAAERELASRVKETS